MSSLDGEKLKLSAKNPDQSRQKSLEYLLLASGRQLLSQSSRKAEIRIALQNLVVTPSEENWIISTKYTSKFSTTVPKGTFKFYQLEKSSPLVGSTNNLEIAIQLWNELLIGCGVEGFAQDSTNTELKSNRNQEDRVGHFCFSFLLTANLLFMLKIATEYSEAVLLLINLQILQLIPWIVLILSLWVWKSRFAILLNWINPVLIILGSFGFMSLSDEINKTALPPLFFVSVLFSILYSSLSFKISMVSISNLVMSIVFLSFYTLKGIEVEEFSLRSGSHLIGIVTIFTISMFAVKSLELLWQFNFFHFHSGVKNFLLIFFILLPLFYAFYGKTGDYDMWRITGYLAVSLFSLLTLVLTAYPSNYIRYLLPMIPMSLALLGG